MRAAGRITGPITPTLAASLDAVYVRRDGFYNVVSPSGGTEGDVNDRNRFFTRAQLLFEPNDRLSVRIIGDYTHRDESCCGAVYLNRAVQPLIGALDDPATPINGTNGNNIINVLRDLGQSLTAFSDPYSRNIYISPGRTFDGTTRDWGISGEVDYDLGGAHLTSITAYRNYRSGQPGDVDYGTVDILYRAPPGVTREFKTFTQELRLQGEAFNRHLDWLIGAYYANEDLDLHDNLRFGNQYGRFATCRIISGGGLAGLYSPTSPNCMVPVVGPGTILAATGASGPDINSAFTLLDGLNNLGSTQDRYSQNSRNWAIFTHNIWHITDQLDFTVGFPLHERAQAAEYDVRQRQYALPGDSGPRPRRPGEPERHRPRARRRPHRPRLSGQFDVGAERRFDQRSARRGRVDRHRRAVLAAGEQSASLRKLFARLQGGRLQPRSLRAEVPDLPVFRDAGRGAGAGRQPAVRSGNQQRLRGWRQNIPRGPITVDLTFFRQDFRNFQLNTFNGTVFLVQTINGCDNLIGGSLADQDQSASASGSNFNASAATTGACAAGDVTYGVRSQGIELEASIRPRRDMSLAMGMTLANTKYRGDLVGNDTGAPLDPALRELPGQRLSNAPRLVVTGAFTLDSPARQYGAHRPALRRCARLQRLQYGLGPVPAEEPGQLCRGQRPPRRARAG